MSRILHILTLDKFTVPICSSPIFAENSFLVLDTGQTKQVENEFAHIYYFKTRLRNNFIYNILLFYKLCSNSEKIILHGNTVLSFFLIFPIFFKKIHFVIYGLELELIKQKGAKGYWYRFFYSKIPFYLTHIEEDVIEMNNICGGRGKLIYNQVYFSNVISDDLEFKETPIKLDSLAIMVGNSRDSANNHEYILNTLGTYDEKIAKVILPLSYGTEVDYANRVEETAISTFGSKAIILKDFLPLDEYLVLLNEIDCVCFYHHRQEAMGITIQLLSMNKIIFMNPKSNGYISLKSRGFAVFELGDLELYMSGNHFFYFNIDANLGLLNKYYSGAVFNENWRLIFA